MSHPHDHVQPTGPAVDPHPVYRTWILAGAALALIIGALFAQQPAKAPTPSDVPNLAMAFAATALPQPEPNCQVVSYNAKGGLLAKPQLVCAVNGKDVRRSLPNPTGGKDMVTYRPVARPSEDAVILTRTVGEGEVEDVEWYAYSFRTWKLVALKDVNAVTDVFGWMYAVVSPDAQRMAWMPNDPETGGSTSVRIVAFPSGTQTVATMAMPGESFGTGRALDLKQTLGWKDARTVIVGVYQNDVLAELREVAAD